MVGGLNTQLGVYTDNTTYTFPTIQKGRSVTSTNILSNLTRDSHHEFNPGCSPDAPDKD